jgi:hypothetical protein
MPERMGDGKWQVRMVRAGLAGLDRLTGSVGLPDISKLPGLGQSVRPADISGGLYDAMLSRENIVEDANYQKVVPNHYLIQVSRANYARQFQPIAAQIVDQWRSRLLEGLMTANNRLGRKQYRFGGRIQVEVQPADDLKDGEARIYCRIEPEPGAGQAGAGRSYSRIEPEPGMGNAGQGIGAEGAQRPPAHKGPPVDSSSTTGAFLELRPSGQRWVLYPGVSTIGRGEQCQIYLDSLLVQEKRLVSGLHAYIVMESGRCVLYDGAPDGRPSSNGTYVNGQPVPLSGCPLHNGDTLVLAAVDPQDPRDDTPGTAIFTFRLGRGTS